MNKKVKPVRRVVHRAPTWKQKQHRYHSHHSKILWGFRLFEILLGGPR